MAKPLRYHFFIAVMPPEIIAEGLYKSLQPLRDRFPNWRWKTNLEYHITLQYPGPFKNRSHVEEQNIGRLFESLQGMHVRPPVIDLARFEVMPALPWQKNHILGLHMNMHTTRALSDLRDQIDEGLMRTGHDIDGHYVFRPHMTLAYVPREDTTQLLAVQKTINEDMQGALWRVDRFHAVQCRNTNIGPREYHPVAAYGLATGAFERVGKLKRFTPKTNLSGKQRRQRHQRQVQAQTPSSPSLVS